MNTTNLYVLKKDNLFVSRDGETMTDTPSQAGLFSKTVCWNKYPGYEMLTFAEVHWYAERKAKEAVSAPCKEKPKRSSLIRYPLGQSPMEQELHHIIR